MPTPPPPSGGQAAALGSLIGLAQKDAVNAGNQSKALDMQVQKLQAIQTLDQNTYNFWDGYINSYWTEQQHLNGFYLSFPVTQTDYDNLLNQKGRLYSSKQLEVVRVPEYEYSGQSSTDPSNELNTALPNEQTWRTTLASGFTNVPIASFYLTRTAVTPTSTSVTVEYHDQTNVPLPSNLTQVLFQDTGVSSIPAQVTNVGPMTPYTVGSGTYYQQVLTIALPAGVTFTTIPSGSQVLNTGPGFTNAERTTKTASSPYLQPTLNAYIAYYNQACTFWLNVLNQQYAAITGNTAENNPDVTYDNSVQSLIQYLTTYLTTMDVSDTGLAQNKTYNTQRTQAIPNRITWIAAQLGNANAYNQRYSYANLLYKQNDGIVFQIQRTQAQSSSLLQAQAASNQRAATYSQQL